MKDDLHQAIEALEEAAAVLTWPGFAKGALALRRVLEAVERVDATLVAAAEREACADICDQHATCEGTAQLCAAAIRARGQA
jgi:hypothetical protein